MQIDALIAAFRYREALQAAREAWVQTRDPGLVPAMEKLAALVDVDPITTREGERLWDAWIRRCEQDDPADVDVLLDVLFGELDGHEASGGRGIPTLRARTPDPRLGRQLVRRLKRFEYMEHWRAHDDFLTASIDLVASLGEEESVGQLSVWRQLAGYRGGWTNAVAGHLQTLELRTPRTRSERPDLASTIPDPKPPPPCVDAAWQSWWESPADLGVRALLADRLQEAGDPRGEFIALQLARGPLDPPSERERALLRQWEPKWLGSAGRSVQAVVWKNGFPTLARLGPGARSRSAHRSRLWFTLEEVDVTQLYEPLEVLDHAPLPSLTSVHGLHVGQLAALGSRTWTRLGVRGAPEDHATLFDALDTLALPALDTLSVAAMAGLRAADLDRLLVHPRIAEIETLLVDPTLLEALADRAGPVGLATHTQGWRITLRDDGSRTLTLRFTGRDADRPVDSLRYLLLTMGDLDTVIWQRTAHDVVEPDTVRELIAQSGATLA